MDNQKASSARAVDIFVHRFNVTELSEAERDILVMSSGMHMAENTTRKRITYRYHNVEVCVDTILLFPLKDYSFVVHAAWSCSPCPW